MSISVSKNLLDLSHDFFVGILTIYAVYAIMYASIH